MKYFLKNGKVRDFSKFWSCFSNRCLVFVFVIANSDSVFLAWASITPGQFYSSFFFEIIKSTVDKNMSETFYVLDGGMATELARQGFNYDVRINL